jgi:hypothetical protein
MDELQSLLSRVKHHLRRHPEHPDAQRREPPLPAAVTATLARVMRTIHLDNEPSCRSEEIHDAASHHDLPAKLHAELAAPQRRPEHPLRLRRTLPHGVSMCFEKLLTTQLLESGHAASERPAWGRVQRPQAQALCHAPAEQLRKSSRVAQSVRARA